MELFKKKHTKSSLTFVPAQLLIVTMDTKKYWMLIVLYAFKCHMSWQTLIIHTYSYKINYNLYFFCAYNVLLWTAATTVTV